MSDDRRVHDPYAPVPVPVSAAPVAAEASSAAPVLEDLDSIPKAHLIDLASQHGVPVYGTKADIAARIVDATAPG
jgi:hypothetical protein